jgi:guanylate kinase
MGKSSTGKDTIYKKILEELTYLREVISYTTRPIRQGESNGGEYYFVDEKALTKLEEEGKVIEQRAYNTVHGIWKYFTVDDGQIDLKKHDYLVIGTVASYREMSKYFGEEKLVPIYLQVPEDVRLERAIKREKQQEEPNYEEVCRRFLADNKDFSEENLEKANITKRFNNKELQECIEEVIEYITVEDDPQPL